MRFVARQLVSSATLARVLLAILSMAPCTLAPAAEPAKFRSPAPTTEAARSRGPADSDEADRSKDPAKSIPDDKGGLSVRPASRKWRDACSAVSKPGKLGLVVGLEKVFKAEPRDPVWAERVEGELGPRLETALKSITPEVLSLKMECRTMVCHLTLQLTPDASPVTRNRLPQMLKQLYPGPCRPVNQHTYYVLWRHDSASNIRDLPTFLPAATKQIETMARFLRSPEGESYLARFDR
jgi:hypothetical protein